MEESAISSANYGFYRTQPSRGVLRLGRGIPARARRGLARGVQGHHRRGFVLQLDDPGLPDTWDMANPEPSVAEYRKFASLRVEALNHALRDLPEDRIRYHICWGSWHGPHTTDLPLKNIVDVLLQVRAGAFSIEAGNVRHEHEWKVWREVKLPEGKILIPGVVSHATNGRRASRGRRRPHPQFRHGRGPRERHRRHGLRPRRPDSFAARLGEARRAGCRRPARDQRTVVVRRAADRHARGRTQTRRDPRHRCAGIFEADGADEEGTLERLKALRQELLDPKIGEHHGRIVKTTGGGAC
jgi:hypothetical protein